MRQHNRTTSIPASVLNRAPAVKPGAPPSFEPASPHTPLPPIQARFGHSLSKLALVAEQTTQLQEDTTCHEAQGEKVLQLRAANPHERTGTHGGWDLTAHHVVAHSKLLEGLNALSDEQKNKILARAVPDIVTETMLNKFTVDLNKLPGVANTAEAKAEAIKKITADLKNPNIPEDFEIGTSTAGKIRQGFFEWMGGNQFVGPNTSTRPEPEESKDAIDTDVQYMPGNPHATGLIEHGKELYTALAPSKDEKERANKINKALENIIDKAKNIVPSDFDSNNWVEVTEKSLIEKLAARLGRAHMFNYTFFKFPAPREDKAWNHYKELAATNSGGSEFSYGSVKKIPAAVGGGFVFVNVPASRQVISTKTETKTLSEVLSSLDSKIVEDKGKVIVTFKEGVFAVDKKTVRVPGWSETIPFIEGNGNSITFNKTMYDKKQLSRSISATSLYDYLESEKVQMSTYLPKNLYETVKD